MVSRRLQDKLREGAQPFLEPGEQIQTVFATQTGPITGHVGVIVVVTDRNVVLLESSFVGGAAHPTAVRARLPHDPEQIGTLDKSVTRGKVMIGGERHRVVRGFFKEVTAGKAALAA